MNVNEHEFIWFQKYRPSTLEDVVLPTHVKKVLTDIVKSGKCPNLLLCSKMPGTGKTTVSKAICNDLNAELLFVNASDVGIEYFRTEITQFASSKAIGKQQKIVVLDEFDRGDTEARQKVLRPMMEQFSANCSFIITANDAQNIIDPIKSRCEVIEFANYVDDKERAEAEMGILRRVALMLKNEGVKVEDISVLKTLVSQHFPDSRSIINALQKHSRGGLLSSSVLSEIKADSVDVVVEALKAKNFKELRGYAQKYALSYTEFLRELQEILYSQVQQQSIPSLLMIIGDSNRQYRAVADLQIELTYMLCQLMLELQWK